ncbi:MAG: alpha-galactosidase [Candidatus Latescibacteria bacterium]|nr:alpha-galactosidase [Candidatus Latescibacterota bacterium]
MIKKDLLGSVVELEFTLDHHRIEDWAVMRDAHDETIYRSGEFTAQLTVTHRAPRVDLLSVHLEKGGKGFDVNQLHVTVRSPLRDLHRIWVPHMLLEGTLDRVTLGGGPGILTCANRAVAFVAGLNRYGRNRVSVGLLDQTIETEVRGGGITDSGRNRIVEFLRPFPGLSLYRTVYEETIYLNCEEGSWFEAMADFAKYEEEATGARPAPRHPDADQPLYCTWYAHGPHVTQEKIEAEIDMVRDLGFKNYIIDEGWFGREPEPWTYRGDYTPDPNRFPDFHGMIEKLHRAGLNVILWVSPFQIGKASSRYEAMKPYLSWWNQFGEVPYFMATMWPWVMGEFQGEVLAERLELCPRTGITETYVPELVERLMRDYEMDGLKIDFLDQIMVMPCRADHPHRYENLGEPVMKTVRAMIEAIRGVKSDAIVEFRPPYANLVLRPFATLYRAQDCPWDVDMNRRLCAWMKAFTPQPGPLVVADYLTFPPEETPINIAKSLAAVILYSVPSVAEDFRKLSPGRMELLRQWLAFYSAHRQELVTGRWRPLEFDPHYSTVVIEGEQETFIGFFKETPGQVALTAAAPERIYLINATGSPSVRTRLSGIAGHYDATVCDPFLREIGPGCVTATEHGVEIDEKVPEGGMLCLSRKKGR